MKPMKISIENARLLGTQVLTAQGVPGDIAADVAEHLVESDRCGYTSHGLSILPTYRQSMQAGHLHAEARATCIADRGGLLMYDGHGGFGQHVGKTVLQAGIERVKQTGHCILTIRRSHHLGRMGYYGEMAAAAGYVLLSFTNVINRPPVVAPFGGRVARLTTNPVCFAGPMPNGRPPLVADVATSAVAFNKARVAAAKGEPLPEGSIIDANGRPTTDASVMFADPPGAILPFGAHKGYALGLVAELLAGVLSGGGTVKPDAPRDGRPVNNMFAVLIDPGLEFGLAWEKTEVENFLTYLHDTPPAPGFSRVQYPGEYEAHNRTRNATHLELDPAIWNALAELAQSLGVEVPGQV